MSNIMKGIGCCADCANYSMKKHKCAIAKDEGGPTNRFYTDCPLPTVTKEVKWISINERMPEEHDTFFAKLKGTDKWKPGLFEKMSDDVRCVVLWPDGTRRVHHSYTVDGRWAVETVPPEGRKVTHWMENPELPKEET